MSKEKQIEEMAKYSCTHCEWEVCGDQCLLDRTPSECDLALTVANTIHTAGYRKQSEGEWREDIIAFCNVCSSCGAKVDRYAIKCNSGKLHYCPNCGAKMKGGE